MVRGGVPGAGGLLGPLAGRRPHHHHSHRNGGGRRHRPLRPARLHLPGPDKALEAMFGQETTISTPRTGVFFKGSECWVRVPERKSLIFYSAIGYIYRDRDPWTSNMVALGNTHSTFSFPDVDGFGEARIDTGPDAHYGTTVFTCEDHYLVLNVDEFSLTRGDVRANLINLTQSALPWLCQDQPIPGLGQTMEQVRPRGPPPHPPNRSHHDPREGVDSASSSCPVRGRGPPVRRRGVRRPGRGPVGLRR